jgi:hypothetical protein
VDTGWLTRCRRLIRNRLARDRLIDTTRIFMRGRITDGRAEDISADARPNTN